MPDIKPDIKIAAHLLIPQEVSKFVHKSVGTLANDRLYRRGLPYIKLRGRILYDMADILKYLEDHKIRPEK